MNTSCVWFATRAAPVLGAALVALAWAYGRDGGAGIPSVGGPEALRRELRLAQARELPVEAGPVTADAGLRVYTAEEGADALALAEGLVPVAGAGGAAVWPVTLYEDGETRETVFLNADGQEAGRLPPPDGYDPGWALEAAFPGGVPGGVESACYAPSRVALTVTLVAPEEGVSGLAEEGRTDAGAAPGGNGAARADEGGGGASGAGGGACGIAGGAQDRSGANGGADAGPDGGGAAGPETVFVDARTGDDACTGRARSRAAGGAAAPDDGPKRSLAAGLAALAEGGRLVVTGGAFDEGLDVRGRAVDVRIDGEVALGRNAAPRRDGAGERSP